MGDRRALVQNELLNNIIIVMKVHYLSSSFNVKDAQQDQLFLPEELESIRLSKLREKRHQLEDKLKLVSNRISFRKKKEEQ